MAITLVGTTSGGAIDGGNATVDLTVLTGLAQNDVVYASIGVSHRTLGAAMVSSGWTAVVSVLDDGASMRSATWRKVMGATPDTSVEISGSANAADSCSVVVVALRGVDTTTPEDATATTAFDGTGSTNPDCPSITTVTNGAWVLAIAHGRSSDAAVTAPTNYINLVQIRNIDTDVMTAALSTREIAVAGAENPASYTAWVTGRWITHTVAVRPASGSTYTIAATGGSYALTGTAASLEFGYEAAADAGSYALTGTSASLEFGFAIDADAGSYALTGTAASLEFGYAFDADSGSYALSGTNATLTYDSGSTYTLVADAGSYALTGGSASLEFGFEISADAGAYAVTGTEATLTYAGTATEPQRGGWLSDEQISASDEHRRKRKARERELEETIELAYKRLTGKVSAKKIIEPTKGEPEKLSELGRKLAAQLVTKGQDSARLRTRNAQIIADLKRLANEVIEYQEAQAYAMQMEEEAIVMLLLA